jgi:uncharacterized protein YndB with AHSA1/START domain
VSANPKTITITVERLLAATPEQAFDAWLDPAVPGTPWNMAEKLILDAREDGLFYWQVHGTPHYGRFTEVVRGHLLRHTWMSPYTSGLESMVGVTFQPTAGGTRMTLVHSGLPDSDGGRSHDKGWNFFLDGFSQGFARAA